MSKFIAITTIFPPTKAVCEWGRQDGWTLIVAGDEKGPSEWKAGCGEFLSFRTQNESNYELVKLLPKNHYCRKMMAYLTAISKGAELILDTDDDNYLIRPWDLEILEDNCRILDRDQGMVNIYSLFTDEFIWPRGFPLDYLHDSSRWSDEIKMVTALAPKVGVWQGLVDGDPDVDAIYRLTIGNFMKFDQKATVILGKGTFCPFNSQNTIYMKELFPLLYLPAFVTFRFTDILRGIVAQPIMQAAGYHLAFSAPNVTQERNEHNLMIDFESEIPCYLRIEESIITVKEAVKSDKSILQNLEIAYQALNNVNIIPDDELPLLNAWIADLKTMGYS